jgi:hypothetical protein
MHKYAQGASHFFCKNSGLELYMEGNIYRLASDLAFSAGPTNAI